MKPASTGKFYSISTLLWHKLNNVGKILADEVSFVITLPWYLPCRDRIKGTQLYVPTALTLILLTWRIWSANNASRWQMGFNSAFKGLNSGEVKTGVKTSKFVSFTDYGANRHNFAYFIPFWDTPKLGIKLRVSAPSTAAESTMVTVRTIWFKTEDLFIWPTQHFYIFCVIPTINSNY